MGEKRFVLGVGAQKAATTWLHNYMNEQDSIDLGHIKEHSALTRRHQGYVDAIRKLRHVRSRQDLLRWRMRGSLSFYVDYFARKVRAPGIHTTGDITPRYALLDEGLLRTVKKRFASRGLTVRPVFVMRDPVERCWSAFRMDPDAAREGRIRLGNKRAGFLEYCTEPRFRGFTAYHETIERLEAVFPPEDVFIGFYETLFEKTEIQRLSKWLGVPASYDKASRKRNASASRQEIPPAARAAVACHFRDVYAAIAEKYPEVRSLWSGFACLTEPQDVETKYSEIGNA